MKFSTHFAFIFFLMHFIKVEAQISMPVPSPSATTIQGIGLAKVSVDYSRPSLKGRKMMGSDIIPYGKVWRTGANRIPNLKVDKTITIGGKTLEAGDYGIITIPGQKEWTIIISNNANQWGTYNYKESEDKFRFTTPAIKSKNKEETFTIGFTDIKEESASMFIHWENDLVKFPLNHDSNSSILEEINTKMSAAEISNDTYYDAAEYYYKKGLDLNKALAWANKVVDNDKQYWTYALRAKIAAKSGKCDIAVADAKLGIEMAKKENDPAYVRIHQKVLDDCAKKK
jgi:hypothetical protein